MKRGLRLRLFCFPAFWVNFMDLRVYLLLACTGLFAMVLLKKSGLMNTGASAAAAVLLTALAIALRAAAMDYETLDYQNFLSAWVRFFRDHGGLAALKHEIGNYNIPYLYFLALFSYSGIKDLYLIKILSIFFDVILAFASMKLVSRVSHSVPRLLACFFTVLMLPTVYLNGSLWAQCDSSYVAFALLGIWFALEDRPWHAMVCAAVSFGFKLQAVFILPVYAVLWMMGKFKIRHFLAFPISYTLLVMPAVIAGRPFVDTLTLYFSQTGSIGDGLNYNSPSAYSFFQYSLPEQYHDVACQSGIAAAFAFMLILLIVCYVNRSRLSEKALMAAALLFAIGIPYLLPHMHDRYFFGADALSVVLAFVMPVFAAVPLLVQFASYLGYYAYLNMRFLLLMDRGALALAVALFLAFIAFFMALRKKEKIFSKAY